MKARRIPILAGAVVGFLARTLVAASPLIENVRISASSFAPSLGETVSIAFDTAAAGRLSVRVLDRDGYPVRTLAQDAVAATGRQSFSWNGRDERGTVVPDEAWSFKIDLVTKEGRTGSYFPARGAAPMTELRADSYARATGVLRYTLPRASRVHVQAGSARVDPATHKTDGPVLKTIVNREPRAAGAVVEQWNGLDESGTLLVPDQPNFVISIAATPLPENSVITVGNRTTRFIDLAGKRTGRPLLDFEAKSHAHHQALTALEDASPRLRLDPANAQRVGEGARWRPRGDVLTLHAALEGPAAGAFLRAAGTLMTFVDGKRIASTHPRSGSVTIDVPLGSLRPGSHVVAVNWLSPYGPVAVNALQFDLPEKGGTAVARSDR